MDQSRALNALAPHLALAKSATSPRAAADLITQATSASNTFVFAELLAQPNIQKLKSDEQYAAVYRLGELFAWGTWEQYQASEGLPQLTDAQTLKLRLLSLMSIAADRSSASNLSYTSLCTRLDLQSTIDLEHLVTEAIYSNLITGTLNPANQTVVITSVAPLRDLAPGSIGSMIGELQAWSARCDGVLGDLEAEIAKVRSEAKKRHAREAKTEKQVKAVMDAAEKSAGGGGSGGGNAGGRSLRGGQKQSYSEADEDAMDIDGGMGGGKGTKGGAGGGLSGLVGKLGGGGGGGSRGR